MSANTDKPDGDRLPTVGDGGAGVPLTRFERLRIDFTRTTVVHARWCKSAASLYDVTDWTAHYDHTLTVGEHMDMYARVSASVSDGPTMREVPTEVLAGRRV